MKSRPTPLTWQLLALTLNRVLVATAFRMVYPFLPAFARGLGISIQQVTLAVSARSALGIFSPLIGSLADRKGRRLAFLAGLGLLAASLLLVAGWPVYRAFFVGLAISGLASIILDSTVHAYVGDRVPYEQRGRALAVVESGWSIAFIIGIPIAGWLIVHYGWRAPFAWLGISALLMGAVLYRIIPAGLPPAIEQQTAAASKLPVTGSYRRSILPLLGLLFSLLVVTANQLVNIIFGVWMEDVFNLKIEQLGIAATLIGIAGVLGVVLVALLTDRLGKRPAIGMGLTVNALACLALLALGHRLWGALLCLFLFYLSFEFTLTSSISLMSELAPLARGAFMAANLVAISAGDSLGALVGPYLMNISLSTNAITSAVLDMMALLLLTALRPQQRNFPQPAQAKETTRSLTVE